MRITPDTANDIEVNTREQGERPLWYYRRRIRLTASNFGWIVGHRKHTEVANIVKSLLYRSTANATDLLWGKTDARKAYLEYMAISGCTVSTVKSGLVIDGRDSSLAVVLMTSLPS